jgi:hypothetical protein
VSQDTPQQARVLRSKSGKAARAVRKKFPVGTRVTSADHDTGVEGTVQRHVPGLNAQGGHLVVKWDTGTTGNTSAIALRVVPSS